MRNYGLIGFPLGHSFSRNYFKEKFSTEDIDADYQLYELQDIHLFPKLLQTVALSGLNVTIPYKESILPYLNEIDPEAKAIGAVNVIQFIQRKSGLYLKGYNTDVIGFEKSISPLLKFHHQSALILGTGGAAKAVAFALKKIGLSTTYVSRFEKKGCLTYQQLTPDILNQYMVIINASPVGTYPNIDQCPKIPYPYLSSKHLLYDLVYNPTETLFLKKGRQQNATTLNGKSMLIGQADAAWKIWNEDTLNY